MSTSWDEVHAEYMMDTYYAELGEEEYINEQLEEKNAQKVCCAIQYSYSDAQPIVENLHHNLENMPESLWQAKGLNCCILLEVVERELVAMPLLFGMTGELNEVIHRMVSRSLPAPAITYHAYELISEGNTSEVSGLISSLRKEHPPKQKELVVESSKIWTYREKLSSYRNAVAHGRELTSESDSVYVQKFISLWRDNVINRCLNRYGMSLDDSWKLSDPAPPFELC